MQKRKRNCQDRFYYSKSAKCCLRNDAGKNLSAIPLFIAKRHVEVMRIYRDGLHIRHVLYNVFE